MKQDKKSNKHNAYVQSPGIIIAPIGYGGWETKYKIKQAIYVCTRSPSWCITKQTIAPLFFYFPTSNSSTPPVSI